ncbi:MAG: hypothetical protein JST43_08250 [Bacteroidetes bacterium]|nr:hypothetical protein [Bacteroidota bacterium]MBS1541579.1 hypothetical protein [Bacteroidota bacterium]
MKNVIAFILTVAAGQAWAQSVVGTWQQTDSKTCLQSQMKESDTEKELEGMMGSHAASTVAKLIVFKKDGSGQEGIFSVGKKKGSDLTPFQYKVSGQELQFVDKKSGMITQRFVIEELTENSLKIHDAMKECESKSFVRAK